MFPTLDFPSDHAVVSACFHPSVPLRGEPSLSTVSAIGLGTERTIDSIGVESVRMARKGGFSLAKVASSDGGNRGGMSLYEYWGITDATGGSVARNSSFLGLESGWADDDGDYGGYEEVDEVECGEDFAARRAATVDRAVEGWFIRAAARLPNCCASAKSSTGRNAIGGVGDLDERRKQLNKMVDRPIWIVFRYVDREALTLNLPSLDIAPYHAHYSELHGLNYA